LIAIHGVFLAYGSVPLLDRSDLRIDAGERVCLLGRNGTGKTSLMRLIHGLIEPDDGRIVRQAGVRTALLRQEVPEATEESVRTLVEAEPSRSPDELDWQWDRRLQIVLEGLGLDPDAPYSDLSGGLKRRVFLARALASQPDLLLLDEPTNHLDIPAITWLETYLAGYPGSLLFVTHDRVFLQTLATRIVEMDRGVLTSYPGDYATYVRRKSQEWAVEETERALFDKKLAQEEAWIRRGIKARRTRNEGRVRALERLREIRRGRRDRIGRVKMTIEETERSGKLVLETRNLHFAYEAGNPIVDDLSMKVLRGDKVGLIGPNGSGKTTLLRLLLGELEPQAGEVRHGTRLEVSFLDQMRTQLRDDQTLVENIADGSDTVLIGGTPRHVITYLGEFLFPPDRARSPVSVLSGGERNRLLLARLFAHPSNLLVLDEPTNDLDTETLELLEERLMDYAGTVLLVSHDRAFVNNVVTSTLAFEGNGSVLEYVGGYDDWLRQRAQSTAAVVPASQPKKTRTKASRERKLTYAEKLELEELPASIEALEATHAELQSALADPDLYKSGKDAVTASMAKLEAVEAQLEAVYARWEELESLPEF
jgi:ATP-binding cassette subfamily F protein uup